MLQTVRVEKADEKNDDDLSKKSKSVKAVYIYASESCHYTLSENSSL